MKILVIAPKNKTVFNFRGDLIRDMIAHGHEVVVIGPNRDFVDDIMALGVSEFKEVPLVKDNMSVRGDLKYLSDLKAAVRAIKPELVFSYTIKPVIYGSMAAASAGVRRIYPMITGLGRVYSSTSAKARAVKLVTNMLYRHALKNCDKVIFQNSDDINELVKANVISQDKAIQVNGSGVNMARFEKTPLPDGAVFLMVSRIIREKGVMIYCEAARRLKAACPEARCILLGGFDNSIGALGAADLQPYIDDGSIEHPGEVKDPVEFYQKASVFVLPSYYREGLPRTILEAMSCGRAVVTTDWTGCREPIEDGKNGYLVPVKDADALADRMIKLAQNAKLRQSMGDNAYATCADKYDVIKVNAAMREIMGY